MTGLLFPAGRHKKRTPGVLLLLGALAAFSAAPAQVRGQPSLAVRTLPLPALPRLVGVADWEGGPVVMAVLPAENGQEPSAGGALLLARLSGGKLAQAARWPLPPEVRWLEPLQMAGGNRGWLALIGSAWYAGRAEGGSLRWELLCACDTLFAAGRGFLPPQARFAFDLDGDGVSEILLPHGLGLDVYRQRPGGGELEKMWRVAWDIRERYRARETELSVTLTLPRSILRDVDGDGVLDYVSIESAGLAVSLQPRPAPPRREPYYVTGRETQRRFQQMGLAPEVLEALGRMPPASHPSQEAFAAALRKEQPEGAPPIAPPDLERVLDAAKAPVPVLFPSPVELEALQPGTRENARIHTVEDMNGDGVLDLILMKSTEPDSLLDQKHQLFWFRGSREGGTLRFPTKPNVFFSEGPAVAELVAPAANGAGQPALFLATTEVTVLAIIRALTLGTASLDLYVYPWRDGKLVAPAPNQGAFTFQLKTGGRNNRPMVVLADLDGDGWREYLFNLRANSLTAVRGSDKGPRFRDDPLVAAPVALPAGPEKVLVRDLDGNGREELVLWHTRKEQPEALRRSLRVVEFLPGP